MFEATIARFAPRLGAAYASGGTTAFIVDAVMTGAAYYCFLQIALRVSALPEQAYLEPSISWAVLTEGRGLLIVALALLLVALGALGALADPWRKLCPDVALRGAITALAVLLAWSLAGIPYNHFFTQAHLADRALLVTLALLIAWRPLFVYPFLILALAALWQFQAPALGGSLFAHKLQIIYPLALFAGALAMHAFTGRFPLRAFAFLLTAMVASAYWEAARAKYLLDWATANELHLVLPAAYHHGWLGNLAPRTIGRISETLAPFNVPAQVLVLALESACLLIFASRRLAIAVLLALCGFHLAVVVLYGFVFWTWIAVDLGLAWVLWRLRPEIHNLPLIAAGAVLIWLGPLWAHAPSLGWLDTRLSYSYRLEAITAQGRVALHPAYFGPYEDAFTMAAFFYLSDRTLTGAYAVTRDRDLAAMLKSPLTRAKVESIEARQPATDRSSERAEFERFVARYVAHREQTGPQLRWLKPLAPPSQFKSTRDGAVAVEGIREIVVIESVSVYENGRPEIMRERAVGRIAISSAGGTADAH